jgi:hypothetical protein
MGLILTPRTTAAIARGLLERRAHQELPIGYPESALRGFDPSHPYSTYDEPITNLKRQTLVTTSMYI